MAMSHDNTFDVKPGVLLAGAAADSESIGFFDDHACCCFLQLRASEEAAQRLLK